MSIILAPQHRTISARRPVMPGILPLDAHDEATGVAAFSDREHKSLSHLRARSRALPTTTAVLKRIIHDAPFGFETNVFHAAAQVVRHNTASALIVAPDNHGNTRAVPTMLTN